MTYKCVLFEYLFALVSQFHREYCDFPAVITSANFDTTGSTDDLVAKAHPDHSNSFLLDYLLRKLD